MNLYTIDFETYYDKDYSLGKMTTQEYILGDKFEIIGVGIKKNDEPATWHSFDWHTAGGRESYRMILKPLEHDMVLAHNAPFDMSILNLSLGIKPRFILDTLAMSRPLHGLTVGGSLAKLATLYRVGEKGTEVHNAIGKTRADIIAEGWLDKYGVYCKTDVELTHAIFKKMRKYTTNGELSVIDGTVRMQTEPKLLLDRPMLEQALSEEKERKQALLDKCEVIRADVMSNKKFAALLEGCGVEAPTKVSPRTGKTTYAFAKSDKELEALASHPNEMVQALVATRLANKSTINESRMARLINLSELGPLCVPLLYCGAATTWRWSGGEKLNLQNLPSRGDNTIRRAIMAPPGYKLVVADSSNIELRTNHALSGQLDSVEKLRRGEDLYKEFASILYSKPVSEIDKSERFVGKVAHLSLGYGCGWVKFKEMCRLAGVELTDGEAQNIVSTWRSTYTMVYKNWKNCDRLIAAMCSGADYALPTAPFVRAKRNMLVTPPQHYIQYPDLHRTDDGYAYTSRRDRATETVHIYGGKIAENLCQHISRNIIAEQFATINKRYPVAMVVHDEVVCVVPKDEAEDALAWILGVMSTSPDWWPEIPLAAEGDIADRYGDAK